MTFEELKQRYDSIPKKQADTSAKCTPLVADFFGLLLQGDSRCLRYLGVTCWYSDKPNPDNYYRYAIDYLKAAIIFNNDSDAWYPLAIIHFGKRKYHGDHGACELKFAWHYSSPDQLELREKICDRSLMREAGFRISSFEGVDLKLNSLVWLWSVLHPFWMSVYKRYFPELFNTHLRSCSLEDKKQLNDSSSGYSDFDQKASAWVALSRHFDWQPQPFYLFYAKNELNKQPIIKRLLQDVIDRCGYQVHLLEWESFNGSIPENAVVGVLTDMALFAESRNENTAYEAVQKHVGKKLLIPWQLPIPDNETFWAVYWASLPEDWKGDWKHIPVSLLDNPLDCLLGRNGMLEYVFPQIMESAFVPLVTYLQQRMVEGKKFSDLYPTNPNNHFDVLSILYRYKNPSNEVAEGEIFDFLNNDLSQISSLLASYLINDDKGKFFFKFDEKIKVSDVFELATAIGRLPLSNPHRSSLYQLAITIIDIFKKSHIKFESMIRELSFLRYSNDDKLIREVLECLRYLIEDRDCLDSTKFFEILKGLIIVPNHAYHLTLKVNDSKKILDNFIEHIKGSLTQSYQEQLFYYFFYSIVTLLTVMQEEGAERLSRQQFEETYLKQLLKLKGWVSPNIQNLIEEAAIVLVKLPKDESDFGKTCRRLHYGFSCLVKIANLLLKREINLELAAGIYEDILNMTRRSVIASCEVYPELKAFRNRISSFQSNRQAPNLLQDCDLYLQQVFADKRKEDNFILGFLQVIDMFIRDEQDPRFQVIGVRLMQHLFEYAELWNRYDHRMAEYALTYLKVYGQASGEIYTDLARAAREALSALEQIKHPPPLPSFDVRLSEFFSNFWDSSFARSAFKKTDDAFLVPPLDTRSPLVGSELFKRAKKEMNWQGTIILSNSPITLFQSTTNQTVFPQMSPNVVSIPRP